LKPLITQFYLITSKSEKLPKTKGNALRLETPKLLLKLVFVPEVKEIVTQRKKETIGSNRSFFSKKNVKLNLLNN